MGQADRPSKLTYGELQAFQYRTNVVISWLQRELHSAALKHDKMHTPHEGHSVIREELDELWEHVKQDTGRTPEAIKEALQVAAMAIRYAVDLSDAGNFPEP